MTIPGFTAEASLYRTRGQYLAIGAPGASGDGRTVLSQAAAGSSLQPLAPGNWWHCWYIDRCIICCSLNWCWYYCRWGAAVG
jgi:hypothetical protein